jgi:hypothetical protein
MFRSSPCSKPRRFRVHLLKLQKTQGQGGYQLYLSPSATSSYRIKRKRQGKNKAFVTKEYRHARDLLGDAKRKEKKPIAGELEASLQREDLAHLGSAEFLEIGGSRFIALFALYRGVHHE